MKNYDPIEFHEIALFNRFRLNLIGLLRLAANVSETALRDEIRKCSIKVLAHYLARAERVQPYVKVARNQDSYSTGDTQKLRRTAG